MTFRITMTGRDHDTTHALNIAFMHIQIAYHHSQSGILCKYILVLRTYFIDKMCTMNLYHRSCILRYGHYMYLHNMHLSVIQIQYYMSKGKVSFDVVISFPLHFHL